MNLLPYVFIVIALGICGTIKAVNKPPVIRVIIDIPIDEINYEDTEECQQWEDCK